jgi:hypothetical protein
MENFFRAFRGETNRTQSMIDQLLKRNAITQKETKDMGELSTRKYKKFATLMYKAALQLAGIGIQNCRTGIKLFNLEGSIKELLEIFDALQEQMWDGEMMEIFNRKLDTKGIFKAQNGEDERNHNGERKEEERDNQETFNPGPPNRGLPPPPDRKIEEEKKKQEYEKQVRLNLEILRRCEKARGPSNAFDIPPKTIY